MEKIKYYTEKQLRSFTTGKLGWLYMNLFRNERGLDQDPPSRLELITQILHERTDVKDKLVTLRQIRHQLSNAVAQEDYTSAALLRDMQHYYEMHIMG